MGVQHLKCHQSQAQDTRSGRWGWFLLLGQREVQDVQPQPSSLAAHRSYEGEETELAFPGIPGDKSKSTAEEEVSSLPTNVEAPALLRKAKYYRQQRSSLQSHSQREMDAANPPVRLSQLLPLVK